MKSPRRPQAAPPRARAWLAAALVLWLWPPLTASAAPAKPADARLAGADEPADARLAELRSRLDNAAILIDNARLEEAETELSRLAEFSRALGGSEDATLALLRGNLRLRQQRLDEARESYRGPLDGVRRRTDPAPWDRRLEQRALAGLAEVAAVSDRCDEALAWNDQLMALAERGGQASDELSARRLRAGIHCPLGQLSPGGGSS